MTPGGAMEDRTMMIEFEDHCEENQKALLAYLEAKESDGARSARHSTLANLWTSSRHCRYLKLAWAAVCPRSGL